MTIWSLLVSERLTPVGPLISLGVIPRLTSYIPSSLAGCAEIPFAKDLLLGIEEYMSIPAVNIALLVYLLPQREPRKHRSALWLPSSLSPLLPSFALISSFESMPRWLLGGIVSFINITFYF